MSVECGVERGREARVTDVGWWHAVTAAPTSCPGSLNSPSLSTHRHRHSVTVSHPALHHYRATTLYHYSRYFSHYTSLLRSVVPSHSLLSVNFHSHGVTMRTSRWIIGISRLSMCYPGAGWHWLNRFLSLPSLCIHDRCTGRPIVRVVLA